MSIDPKPLTSNSELHRYLLQLADILAKRSMPVAADSVRRAATQSTGLSTEFLGESRIALVNALEAGEESLTDEERNHLIAVIAQLDVTLRR
jgi:hypothetical protein